MAMFIYWHICNFLQTSNWAKFQFGSGNAKCLILLFNIILKKSQLILPQEY